MKVTSVHTLMQKNTKRFFVFQDSSVPDVYGDIYVHVIAIIKQPA